MLLDDPTDLDGFGDTLASLLDRPEENGPSRRAGPAGGCSSNFVGDRHLLAYARLIHGLVTG